MESLFIMTHGPIQPKPVGLAMSVLRRCRAFAKNGIDFTLLVNDHYLSFESSVEELCKDGLIDESSHVRYMHNELANDTDADSRPFINVLSLGPEYRIVRDENNPNVARVYSANKYVMFVWFSGERVSFVDGMVDGRRSARSFYDAKGYVRKVERFDSNNSCTETEFYGREGNLYLKSYKDADPYGARGLLDLRQPDGSVISFKSNAELIAYWLRTMVFTGSSPITLISEYGFFRRALQNLRKELPNLRVVYTLHNNHLAGSNRFGAPIKPELVDFFSHLDDYDSVVVLTEDQRMDIMKQFPSVENISVIPHHTVEDRQIVETRDRYRVVVLGRFSEHKGQLDAIRAFRTVVNHVPQARLELYGRGPTEDAIRSEIVSQDLSQHVQVMGFVNGSKEVYSSASIGLFPTLYEGFGLSIQESMQYGCVPIAYDSKYGIRALIRDGVDGLIIDRSNVEELAASILLLLRNDKQRQEYSMNCESVYDRFSEKSVVESWRVLLEGLHA